MNRFLSLSVLLLLFVPSLLAQTPDEGAFKKSQAKTLNAFASKAQKKGFPKKAQGVYQLVVNLYDPDNEEAQTALGNEKVGNSWSRKPGHKKPRSDEPNPAGAKALRKEFEKISGRLVKAHKEMAKSYQEAGRNDRAQFHYKTLLRFAPNDADAKKHLELVDVADGLSGTALEQTLYQRGIMLNDIVKEEGAKEYQVERLPDTDRHDILDNAKVEYISVKSDHFTLRGDFPEELLIEAAIEAERAYSVMKVAFAGYEAFFNPDTKNWHSTEFSFFKSKDTFLQICHANQNLFANPESFKFTTEHTSGTSLGGLRVSASGSSTSVNDGAVRAVARTFAAVRAAALSEGIGHTFVGLMLRNNRAFLVDLEKQIGTQTEEEDIDQFNPDMDMWEDLAIEQAWSKTTVPAKRLPMITADKFDDAARIKSWSFCHYLMLRDPTLLRHLDMTAGLHSVIEIQKKFERAAGVSLETLDKEWKDFFTGATPVMRAIKGRKDPMLAVSDGVKKWLDAINAIRKEDFHAAPVNWSAGFSSRCKAHADYLEKNELSGPEHEQRQDPQLPDSTHPGNMFAHMAMVSTQGSNPKKVIKEWMRYPGYRDLFFVNTLKTIGLYAEGKTVVINVAQGLVNKPRSPGTWLYPRNGMTRVPNSVKVADLGPEFQVLLKKNGHGDLKVVGFPLSIHCGNSILMPKRDSFKCKVRVNDREDVEGIMDIADDGDHRRTSSPGTVVFYPLKPIKKGAQVEVEWINQRGNRLERYKARYTH